MEEEASKGGPCQGWPGWPKSQSAGAGSGGLELRFFVETLPRSISTEMSQSRDSRVCCAPHLWAQGELTSTLRVLVNV